MRPHIFVSLLLGLAVMVLLLCMAMGYNGLYGQDAYLYFQSARQFQDYFIGRGPLPGTFFPPLYSMLCGLVMWVTPATYSCQWMSMMAAVVFSYTFYRTLLLLFPNTKQQAPFALLIVFLSPYLFRVSIACMSDSLALAFTSVSIYYLLRFHQEEKPHFLFVVVLAANLSVLTRYVSVVPLGVAFLFVIGSHYKTIQWLRLIPWLLLALILSVPFWLVAYNSLHTHGVNNQLFQSLSIANVFKNCFQVKGVADVCYTFPNLLFNLFPVVHPGFISVGALLIFFFRRQDFQSRPLQMAFAATILFLPFMMCIPNQNPRHQLTVAPFLFLLFYVPFTRFMNFMGRFVSQYLILVVLLFLQLGLVFSATKLFVNAGRSEKTMAAFVAKHAGNKIVYEFAASSSLKTYAPHLHTVSIYDSAVCNVPCTSLLLIQPEVVSTQWKHRLPEQNFNTLMLQCDTTQLAAFEFGWRLYSLQKRECK